METTAKPAKVVYTAKTHTVGGRGNGVGRSSDGHLEVKLSTPGANGTGTNPEQLFAVGWSACFEGALGSAARQLKTKLPEDTAIDAEVDLCSDEGGYYLQARLNITIPGVEKDLARQLVDLAIGICPYSKAVKGNITVEYNLIA